MIGVDLTGPFSIADGLRSQYIFTAIDYLTKWVEACPISNKAAVTTARVFKEEILARHGCPQIVVTDNGQEWAGEFQALMEKSGIEVRKTSPYHPQANGLVERFHGTLKEKLIQAAQRNGVDWHLKEMPEILMGYRTSPQASTKYSPFELLYGRKPVLPIENLLASQPGRKEAETGEAAVPAKTEKVHRKATANIQQAQARQVAVYRKRMRPNERQERMEKEIKNLQAGALVMIKNHKKKKLDPSFLGPFIFEKDSNDKTAAVLRNSTGKRWSENIFNIGIFRSGVPNTGDGCE